MLPPHAKRFEFPPPVRYFGRWDDLLHVRTRRRRSLLSLLAQGEDPKVSALLGRPQLARSVLYEPGSPQRRCRDITYLPRAGAKGASAGLRRSQPWGDGCAPSAVEPTEQGRYEQVRAGRDLTVPNIFCAPRSHRRPLAPRGRRRSSWGSPRGSSLRSAWRTKHTPRAYPGKEPTV
jgi:hypothetical protein